MHNVWQNIAGFQKRQMNECVTFKASHSE